MWARAAITRQYPWRRAPFRTPFQFPHWRHAGCDDVQRQNDYIPRDHSAAVPQASACGFRKASLARLCAFQSPIGLAARAHLLVYQTIVCSNENAHASNQGSHQNIIPHLREPIIFGFLSEEEFVKSKDCKGCNSNKHNKPHCVKDPRYQELLERIPHNLMCFQLMTHEGYNKPRNNLQSNQPP